MTSRHPCSTLFAAGVAMLALPCVAAPAWGQSVEVTVRWNQPISKPEQIGFSSSPGSDSLVTLSALTEWKEQVTTRPQDRRLNRRAELQIYYDFNYSIPAKIIVGARQTSVSLVLGSRLYNCDQDGARTLDDLIEGNRTNHTNLANAIFSARRMYDGRCRFGSPEHRLLFQNLLVRAVRYYGVLNDRTLDLGHLADDLIPDPDERARLGRLYRASAARQLTLEVNALLKDVNADRDLVREATGELIELAASDEFASAFAEADWQLSRYEAYLLSFEYDDIYKAIETVPLSNYLVYSELVNRVQGLKAFAAAPVQSEEQQAFADSNLTPALIEALEERLAKLRLQAINPATTLERGDTPLTDVLVSPAPDRTLDTDAIMGATSVQDTATGAGGPG